MRKYLACSVLGLSALRAFAQCAMCTSTVDLQQNGPQVGQAFNRSIAFMLLMPALLVLSVGWMLFRRFKQSAQSSDAPPSTPQLAS